jgi:hypothetical protein
MTQLSYRPTNIGLMTKGLPSLDLLVAEMRIIRQDQIQHFDALDSKAGVLLGFSGAIVALRAGNPGPTALIAAILASGAALAAVWAYLPRKFPKFEAIGLRNRYLASDPGFTKLRILDTQVEMITQTADLLQVKAERLKWTSFLLGGSVVSLAAQAILSTL